MGLLSTKRANLALGTTALVVVLSAATPALAQAEDADTIIVTAQRREQNLQDVGVSITALNASQIKEQGLTSSADIGRIAPGVVFAPTTPGGSFASIFPRQHQWHRFEVVI